jgi:thiol-disulfide isomerase/thioredoxin
MILSSRLALMLSPIVLVLGAGAREPMASSFVAASCLSESAINTGDSDKKDTTAEIKLERLKWDALRARITANRSKAKYTIVDVWATDCGPCKENFPHVVQMHEKYGSKGLAVMSVSVDDSSNGETAKAAEAFLKEKKARFTNVLLDEEFGVGYEKFGVNAIPAVFLYGPDGKEIRRFTMDDPDNQFTYAEVDEVVQAIMEGKPLPSESKPKGE